MSDKRKSPESVRFDEMKGKAVVVVLHPTTTPLIEGVLAWVDRYTIGLQLPQTPHVPPGVWIVNKSAIVMIGLK